MILYYKLGATRAAIWNAFQHYFVRAFSTEIIDRPPPPCIENLSVLPPQIAKASKHKFTNVSKQIYKQAFELIIKVLTYKSNWMEFIELKQKTQSACP